MKPQIRSKCTCRPGICANFSWEGMEQDDPQRQDFLQGHVPGKWKRYFGRMSHHRLAELKTVSPFCWLKISYFWLFLSHNGSPQRVAQHV